MAIELKIPKLDMAMETGTISEWLVADGATVFEGLPIYSIENDKAVQEIEAPASGVLRILGQVGEDYYVGTTIGLIE